VKLRLFVLVVLFAVLCSYSLCYSAIPQMINYQGKITTPAGALVDTTVGMTFTIYDDSTGGNTLWADTLTSVEVEKGIFSVLLGSVNPIPDSVFPGDVRYLGVKVGADPEMSPRKAMVSVAYAYKSEYSDTAKYAQVAVSDGDWTPDTAGINIYRLTGNVGIGTPMPAEKLDVAGNIHASGVISSGSSITIDGANDKITASSGTLDFDNENLITTGKATIGPGHTNTGLYAFVAGQNNAATGNNSMVGGGLDNLASNDGGTVGGGVYDTASGIYSTVGGGAINVASGQHSTVAGGNVNTASGIYSTVSGGSYDTASGGGGFYNRARGHYSVVSGGGGATGADSNSAIGEFSAIGGGRRNIASDTSATVAGGYKNTASRDFAAVGGGNNNTASGYDATVGGGEFNTASGKCATIGGGYINTATNEWATIAGGANNDATQYGAAVGGGSHNDASGWCAAIPGGLADTVAGDYSFATGYKVRLTGSANHTFGFGRDFTTSTPHAAIFYDATSEMKVGIQTTSPTARLDVNSSTGYNQVRMRTSYTPTGTSDTNGNVGDVAWDDSYVYIKTSAGWKRAALNTW
jgi:hypothetical protein